MPSGTVTILSLLSGSEYAISSSGFLSSDVPDSELQASVSHTLNVENWWLDSRHCCVHLQAVEGRSLSGVIKTRHHDLQLLPACRTRQLRLSETPQLCLRSRSSGVLGERWLCSMIPSVPKCRLALSLLTRQATGKGINALLRRTFALVCITVGQIRWSMSVVLLSKKSQITLVVFSLR